MTGKFVLGALLVALISLKADAQTPLSRDEYLRQELERIAAEDPRQSETAKKLLGTLDQPETGRNGREVRNRRLTGGRRIVNGIPANSNSAVGALLRGSDPRTARAHCTGTLVGCDKFLTAAHCIHDAPRASNYVVFFQDAGFFRVAEVKWSPEQYKFPYFDLAMLTLERHVHGITPIAINSVAAPLNNSIATVIGFGRTGGARSDYGIKREGSSQINACPPEMKGKNVLCWKYSADIVANRKLSNTCNGDSGGGVFMRDNEGGGVVEKLFGVVSGGLDANCVTDDTSYNVDVRHYRDWIYSAGEGRLSSELCPNPERLRILERRTFLVKLTPTQREARVPIEVPPGADQLRVTMNGEDTGLAKNDFDLYLYDRMGTIESKIACAENGSGQFANCELHSPKPGTWTAIVRTKKGEGEAQVSFVISGRGT